MSLKVLDGVAWNRQKNTLGFSHFTPKSFVASGDGAAGGTTIVSSTLGAQSSIDSDDDLGGLWVEAIECENGPSLGSAGAPLRRRVVSYDHGTTTLTVEAFPFQIKSGDRFKLLQGPHQWLCEDTGGSQVKFLDSGYNSDAIDIVGHAKEGGPYVEVLYASAVSTTQQPLISKTSTGMLSCASFGASTAIGDLVEAWYYPEILSEEPLSFKEGRLDRNAKTGSLGTPRGVKGKTEINGSWDCAFKGPGTGREGGKTHLDIPLGAVFDVAAGGSHLTADAGCTSSSVAYSAGSPSAGDMLCTEEGDVFMATAVAGGAITPSPNLRAIPTSGETVYRLRTYTASEDLNYAMSIKQWYDRDTVEYLFGCVPTVQVACVDGDYLKFTLGFIGADGVRTHLDHAGKTYARSIDMKRPTIISRQVADVRINVDGIDLDVRGFSLDFQLQQMQKANLYAPNNSGGPAQSRDFPQGTLDLWKDSKTNTLIQKFRYGKPMTILIQAGEFVGEPGVFGFWAYEIELTDDNIGDDQGIRTVSIPFRVTEDSTTSNSRWAMAMG